MASLGKPKCESALEIEHENATGTKLHQPNAKEHPKLPLKELNLPKVVVVTCTKLWKDWHCCCNAWSIKSQWQLLSLAKKKKIPYTKLLIKVANEWILLLHRVEFSFLEALPKSTRRTKSASAQMCSLPNCINPHSLNVYWNTKALANWRVLHQNHGFSHKVLHQHVFLFSKNFCTKWPKQVASQLSTLHHIKQNSAAVRINERLSIMGNVASIGKDCHAAAAP